MRWARGGVLLIGETCDPASVEAVRASMGSIFAVPVFAGSEADFLALCGRWPGAVIGTALPATTHYRKTDAPAPHLMVMGNEQAGITDAIAGACTHLVRIPMVGRADSLKSRHLHRRDALWHCRTGRGGAAFLTASSAPSKHGRAG